MSASIGNSGKEPSTALGLGQIGIVVITLKFASITERCLTQYQWNLVEVYSSLVVHAKPTFNASL